MKITEISDYLKYADILEEYIADIKRYGIFRTNVRYYITDTKNIVYLGFPVMFMNTENKLLIFVNNTFHNYNEILKAFNYIQYKDLIVIKYSYFISNTFYIK